MKDILLLHGALGSKTELLQFGVHLESKYKVHYLEFDGHGQTQLKKGFSIPVFAESVKAYIQDHNLAQVDVFGYSMGGYVALYLAAENENLFGTIITLGTKFHWSPEASALEVKKLNPEKIEEKVPGFASYLAKLHGQENWKIQMKNTAQMMLDLGSNELLKDRFSKITNACFIGLGEQDEMVTLEETLAAAASIPNAVFFSLPNTIHPISRVNPSLLSSKIEEILEGL